MKTMALASLFGGNGRAGAGAGTNNDGICFSWKATGTCRTGDACRFKHTGFTPAGGAAASDTENTEMVGPGVKKATGENAFNRVPNYLGLAKDDPEYTKMTIVDSRKAMLNLAANEPTGDLMWQISAAPGVVRDKCVQIGEFLHPDAMMHDGSRLGAKRSVEFADHALEELRALGLQPFPMRESASSKKDEVHKQEMNEMKSCMSDMMRGIMSLTSAVANQQTGAAPSHAPQMNPHHPGAFMPAPAAGFPPPGPFPGNMTPRAGPFHPMTEHVTPLERRARKQPKPDPGTSPVPVAGYPQVSPLPVNTPSPVAASPDQAALNAAAAHLFGGAEPAHEPDPTGPVLPAGFTSLGLPAGPAGSAYGGLPGSPANPGAPMGPAPHGAAPATGLPAAGAPPAAAPAAATPVGDPAAPVVPGHQELIAQGWKHAETLTKIIETETDKEKWRQISPSQQEVFDPTNPITDAYHYLLPINELQPGDPVHTYDIGDMAHMGIFAAAFCQEDFDYVVSDVLPAILRTIKTSAAMTSRMYCLLQRYGINLGGKLTFKRVLLTLCLTVSKNRRDNNIPLNAPPAQ